MDPMKASNDRQKVDEVEAKATRKVQKADREKLRRDRLNDHFLDLAHLLDPGGPKNDKGTILTETLQVLKDLTAEVNRLKAECDLLTEESRELTQEKNELKEEKEWLKYDIENLNIQCHRRSNVMFPWGTGINPSVVMGPAFSYALPVPIAPGSIPLHASSVPLFPFFGNQNPVPVTAPCSTFIPYPTPANPPNERHAVQFASTSHVPSRPRSKSNLTTDHQRGGNSNMERCDESDDVVATELELKMPGSSSQKDMSSGERKSSLSNGSPSTKYSSSCSLQNSSANGVEDAAISNN